MPKFKLPRFNLTLQLVTVFLVAIFCGELLPVGLKSAFYTLSLVLKDGLVFVLPFIIFSCLFSSLLENRGRAINFVILILLCILASSFVSSMTAYGVGKWALSYITIPEKVLDAGNITALNPLFSVKIPTLISSEIALIAGLVFGIFFAIFHNTYAEKFARLSNRGVTFFLKRIFIPILPLFALGYILKMQHEGLLLQVLTSYAPIIVLLVCVNLLYIILLFGLAANFKVTRWLEYLKNILPVGLLGFSTMSSLATMPLTLNAAEKNIRDASLARAIIPATVNTHMIGVTLSLPIIAMAVLMTFGHTLPNFANYLIFAQLMVVSTLAIPGVPCGCVLILLPVFETTLGFTGEMSAFITATYILFDPIVTVGNVLGNSAFAILFAKLFKRFRKIKPETEQALTPVSESD